MMKSFVRWSVLCLVVAGGALLGAMSTSNTPIEAADAAERGPSTLNYIFNEFCDGQTVTIRRGSVSGQKTCCESGQLIGATFRSRTNGNGFYTIDNDGFEWDMYQTGRYAGQFFVFDPAGVLINDGTWTLVPNGQCPTRGVPSSL